MAKEMYYPNEARSEKCSDRFLHCLSQVPCGSLIAWIILLVGLGGLTGGLLIGAQKTRDMLDNDQFLWFMEYTLIGVVVSMFVIGTLLLCVGHVSTEPTSRHMFQTTKKNMCAQGLNVFLMVFCYLLGFSWIVASVVLAVPVYLLSLLYFADFTVTKNGVDTKCIYLVHYGLDKQDFCGADFQNFEREGKQLIISYIAALASSILIAISLQLITPCSSFLLLILKLAVVHGNCSNTLTTTLIQNQLILLEKLVNILDNVSKYRCCSTSPVVFHAVISSSTTFEIGSPWIYDQVVTNVGNAYNPSTGKFTAPTNGIYQFNWYTLNAPETLSHAGLYVNGYIKARQASNNNVSSKQWITAWLYR